MQRADHGHNLTRAACSWLQVSVRLRAVIAERRSELLKWWLLLREEYDRSAGVTGISKQSGRDMLAELRRVARDPAMLELMERGFRSGAGRELVGAGILDSDAFVRPEHGSAGVAAHGVALDLAPMSWSFLRVFLARILAFFPPVPHDWLPLCAPTLHAQQREEQGRVMRRFATDWMVPTIVVGRDMPAVDGMTVVSLQDPSKGVGTVRKDKNSMGIQWVFGLRGKELIDGEVWDLDGKCLTNGSAATILEAPIRINTLIALEKFARSRAEGNNVLLIQGLPCCGKSTLLAHYVQQRENKAPVAPGLDRLKDSDGDVMHTFYFAAGHAASAHHVLMYLAADIYAQTRTYGVPEDLTKHATFAQVEDFSVLHASYKQFAGAVMQAARAGVHGISVLVMVCAPEL
jgi:hypothetical protein